MRRILAAVNVLHRSAVFTTHRKRDRIIARILSRGEDMRIRRLLCLILCLVLLTALPACAGKSGEQPLPAPTAATSAAPEQGAAVPPEEDASGFVLLSEVVPDVILEMRYYSTYNFVGERIDGYEQPVALLTVQAAEALKAVSDEVAAMGYRLKVFDAYRPQTAVTQFVRWAQDADDTRMQAYFYPETEKSALFSQGYIAERSGHSRGSTVDLTLFELRTGREVDMGGTFDYFGARSHADFSGISAEQSAMRALLRDVMVRHGFRPYAGEWWHFTLKMSPIPIPISPFRSVPLRYQTVLRDFHTPSLSAALRDFSALKTFCPAHNTVAGLAHLCYDTEWPRTGAQRTARGKRPYEVCRSERTIRR